MAADRETTRALWNLELRPFDIEAALRCGSRRAAMRRASRWRVNPPASTAQGATSTTGAQEALCQPRPASRHSRPPRSFRARYARGGWSPATPPRRRGEGRVSETADRSRSSLRRAVPTAGPKPRAGTAPSAIADRVPADNQQPSRHPDRIRQRHEARRNGRTAPRPASADRPGGSDRLKAQSSGAPRARETGWPPRGQCPLPPRLLPPSRSFD